MCSRKLPALYTIIVLFAATLTVSWRAYAQDVFFTNGYKIGELSSHQAILWTRLCAQPTPNPVVHQRKPRVFRHPLAFDETMPVAMMDGAVAGAPGFVRVELTTADQTHFTTWYQATAATDYTVHIPIEGLSPDTRYTVRLEGKATEESASAVLTGSFRTPPLDTVVAPVTFTTSTCQYFWSYDDSLAGFKTYQSMLALQPNFLVQTGDYVYYDKPGPLATTPTKARHKWHAINGWPSLIALFRQVPIYMIKDDHDLLADDVHPTSNPYGQLSYAEGLTIWRENAPVGTPSYRTVRWGQDLQLWLLEGREYRSDNQAPDSQSKTILGEDQKAWLTRSLADSDATFKLVVSATPVVGPDRKTKTDNHANDAFRTEGEWLREQLGGMNNVYVINGDRHWQYVSQDSATGLLEFGSGPVSDAHVQGWEAGQQPEHRYLRLIGGFLAVTVERLEGRSTLTMTHYNVVGQAQHTETFTAMPTPQPK